MVITGVLLGRKVSINEKYDKGRWYYEDTPKMKRERFFEYKIALQEEVEDALGLTYQERSSNAWRTAFQEVPQEKVPWDLVRDIVLDPVVRVPNIHWTQL